MKFLEDSELNNRIEKILLSDLPSDTRVLEGEGLDISSTKAFNAGFPIMGANEELVRLSKHSSHRMQFEKDSMTVDDLSTMIDFLAGQLAHDIYLYKLGHENGGAKYVITRSAPKTIFEDASEGNRAYVTIEVLAALERK